MKPKHPTKDIQGILSNKLNGKTVCLCLTGSVAVINSPSVARELMRHGAEVIVAMSKEATDLIQPELLQWATGNPVITDISGDIEHIAIAGERENMRGQADLILICPATANTISKIACGISDTLITTLSTVALGSNTPIVIVPAMHDSMFRNKIVDANIQKLKGLGVTFLGPRMEENKAKVALPEEVVSYIIDYLNPKKDLKNLRFLITAGPSREQIDRVRFISNPSSGKMGMAFAEEIISRGGSATIINGKSTVKTPIGAQVIDVTTANDFVNAMKSEISNSQTGKYNVLISSAALADFTVTQKKEQKISSNTDSLQINLIPTPKLIKEARKIDKDLYIVAFKAETDINCEDLVNKAHTRLLEAKTNLVVANNVHQNNTGRGFGCDTNEVYVIDPKKEVIHLNLSSKRNIASKILDIVVKKLNNEK
jgi:phosphopantothenoylcysteine decarboxylase / phosphopantothenate---cysteine ligase